MLLSAEKRNERSSNHGLNFKLPRSTDVKSALKFEKEPLVAELKLKISKSLNYEKSVDLWSDRIAISTHPSLVITCSSFLNSKKTDSVNIKETTRRPIIKP